MAWWPLDEAAGTAALDATGGGNDGTLVGDVARIAGVSGNAVSLDAGGERIEVPASTLDGADVVTIAMWIATDSRQTQTLVGGARRETPTLSTCACDAGPESRSRRVGVADG